MGSGTGFSHGRNLIISNNHVVPSEKVAKYSTAQFNYELDTFGNPKLTFLTAMVAVGGLLLQFQGILGSFSSSRQPS